LDVDGEEIVIERLFRGSIINYRNFFVSGDTSEVKLTFNAPSVLQELPYDRLKPVFKKFPEFGDEFTKYRLKFIK
jgi:hypothetical protein